MFNIKVCCITLYREEAWGGRSLTWGRAQSHLGATRPRVGICLTRLDALASKYKTRPTLIIVLYCQVGASNPNLTMPTRGRVAPR